MKKITIFVFSLLFFFQNIAGAENFTGTGFTVSAQAVKKNAVAPDEIACTGYSINHKSKKTNHVGIRRYDTGPGIYTIEFDKTITKWQPAGASFAGISVIDSKNKMEKFKSSTNTISFLLKKRRFFLDLCNL